MGNYFRIYGILKNEISLTMKALGVKLTLFQSGFWSLLEPGPELIGRGTRFIYVTGLASFCVLLHQVLVEPGFGRDVRSFRLPTCLPPVKTSPCIQSPVHVVPRERKISTSASPRLPPTSPSRKITFDPTMDGTWIGPPMIQRNHEASPKLPGWWNYLFK